MKIKIRHTVLYFCLFLRTGQINIMHKGDFIYEIPLMKIFSQNLKNDMTLKKLPKTQK